MTKPLLAILLLATTAPGTSAMASDSELMNEIVSFDLVRDTSGSPKAPIPFTASTSIRAGDILELVSGEDYDFDLNVSGATLSSLGNRIIEASTDRGGKAIIVMDDSGGLLGVITEFGQRYQISTSAKGQRRIFKQGYSGREKRIDDGSVPAPQRICPPLDFFRSERRGAVPFTLPNHESGEILRRYLSHLQDRHGEDFCADVLRRLHVKCILHNRLHYGGCKWLSPTLVQKLK